MREGKFEESVQALETIISEHGTQYDLLDLQGMCYFRLKYYEQAVACYSQLADLDPKNPNPLTNLGAVYNRMKRYDQAVDSLRKAIQRDSKKIDAYFNLGIAHRQAGHPDLAISAYKEVLKLNPQFEQAHLNLANVYLEKKNTAMATTHYRTALTINPELEAATRGLKKTQQQEIKKRELVNPFGRLVDPTLLAHKKTASAIKQLNKAERKKRSRGSDSFNQSDSQCCPARRRRTPRKNGTNVVGTHPSSDRWRTAPRTVDGSIRCVLRRNPSLRRRQAIPQTICFGASRTRRSNEYPRVRRIRLIGKINWFSPLVRGS